jgi:hypothetical protein
MKSRRFLGNPLAPQMRSCMCPDDSAETFGCTESDLVIFDHSLTSPSTLGHAQPMRGRARRPVVRETAIEQAVLPATDGSFP